VRGQERRYYLLIASYLIIIRKIRHLHSRVRRIASNAAGSTDIFEKKDFSKHKISVEIGAIVLFRPNSIRNKCATCEIRKEDAN